MPFGVILNTFSQMLRNSKNATLSSEMLDLKVLGLRFCMLFANFSNVFFLLLPGRSFYSILADLVLQRGFLLEHFFTDFANFV